MLCRIQSTLPDSIGTYRHTYKPRHPMTNVLSTITQAGFDSRNIHYGNLRKLFFTVIEWLHHKSHEADQIKRSNCKADQEKFNIAVQLLQDDYLRGIIEGRFSRCEHGGAEHQTVFKVIDEDTIKMTTETFCYD